MPTEAADPDFAAHAPARLKPLDAFEGPLSNRVYLSLKDAILSISIKPGAMLRKGDVCTALGVSRSPVSEAVARLASERLVRVVPQAGTYVARFSMSEIREGAFLRQALELAAIEHVAQQITPEQLRILRRNLAMQSALVQEGDASGFYELDAEFHDTIMNMTGYRRLSQLAQSSWLQVNRARRLILPSPGRIEDTLAEHREIVTALEAHDTLRAREATRRHLSQLIKYIEPLERERPDLFDDN